jgi:hypothetical protein
VVPLFDAARDRGGHPVEKIGVGAAGQRRLLGLAHLGCGNHLHRLGDLRRIFDRLDPAAHVSGVGHFLSRGSWFVVRESHVTL